MPKHQDMDAILTPLNDGYAAIIEGKQYRIIPTDKICKSLDGPVQNCTASQNSSDNQIPAKILFDFDHRPKRLIIEESVYTIKIRGGYRPQAGRKKAPRKSVNKSVTLTKDEWDFLQRLSDGETAVKQAAKILREYISKHNQTATRE